MAQRNQVLARNHKTALRLISIRQFDAETLRLCGYGIVTAGGNFDYSHNQAAALLPSARTARPEARKHSQRRARFGSRPRHSDLFPICAAASRPERRCSDRIYLHELALPATD